MTTYAPTRPAEPARGPVQRAERALAPDLARGAMLLLIALAHAPGVFFNNSPGIDPTPHGLERFYNIFMFTFVHARAVPLFAIMFGYGLIQLARRQDAITGDPQAARSILLRRNAWLVVFGFLHGVFLFSGDILGAYGLMGVAFTLLLLRRGDKVHRVPIGYLIFAAVYSVGLSVMVVMGIVGNSNGDATVPTAPFLTATGDSYADSILVRLAEWPMGTAVFLPFVLIVWVGAWAARRRILEEPGQHRRLLRWGVGAGFGIGILGGLPMGLLSAGFLHVDESTGMWIKMLFQTTGFFGGIAYVCLFGLIALSLSKRPVSAKPGRVVGALVALGQRSMSGYLFQSVMWLVLASPYLLAIGDHTPAPTFVAAGCAVAVWLLSVVGAYAMQRHGYRGPAEVVLRRLTYGKKPRSNDRPPSRQSTARLVTTHLMSPERLRIDDIDRAIAARDVAQCHSRGLIGSHQAADLNARLGNAATRGELNLALSEVPGISRPPGGWHLLLRIASVLGAISAGVGFIVWVMIGVISGWDAPWWIWTAMVAALVMAVIWWVAEAPRHARRAEYRQLANVRSHADR